MAGKRGISSTSIRASCRPKLGRIPTEATIMRFRLYSLLLTAAVATAQGQTAAVDSTFAVPPSGPIACRSVVPPETDPAAYVFEFLNGNDPGTQQWTLAEFDSAGKPLQLVTSRPNAASTPATLNILVVNFAAPTKGERVVILAGRDTSVAAPNTPLRDKPGPSALVLTNGEIESARRLATWFWDHRCRTNP